MKDRPTISDTAGIARIAADTSRTGRRAIMNKPTMQSTKAAALTHTFLTGSSATSSGTIKTLMFTTRIMF
ncbi:MAG: hypothetical protein CMK07_14165 [Ponticaulis sp.]|nr:hypothetical protein [Ponticaulis sp.]